MQVSISKAAKMVGVTRATLYRHIDEKGISVQKDNDGKPKIDVSELVRVYGDKVKTPEQIDAQDTVQLKSDYTAIEQPVSLDKKAEIEVLRERLRNADLERTRTEEERRRERDQLSEQIDMLRQRVEASEEQQKRLTLLLTDQREDKDSEKLKLLEATVEELKKQNRRILQEQQKKQSGFWSRLFNPTPQVKRA